MVGSLGALQSQPHGLTSPTRPDRLHLLGPGVALHELVADGAELRQLHPAGLEGARARHAVAFTLRAHALLHHLEQGEQDVDGVMVNRAFYWWGRMGDGTVTDTERERT
jgi:hypothetical protein